MRFYNIQVLRFFAALGVVVFHSAIYVHNARGGHLTRYFTHYLDYGVILFFAISGFVIVRPALESSARVFLLQRFLRIFPPFWALAIIASVGKLALFGVQRFDPSLLKALTLLPFGTIPYPVGIEWSLVYEVFYYVVIALFVAIVGARRLAATLCAWGVVIVTANLLDPSLTSPLPTVGQIALSGYDLPFICGALTWWLHGKGARIDARYAVPIVPMLLVGAEFMQPVALKLLLQGVAFNLLVLAAVSMRQIKNRKNVLVRGGDWSYGIYLIHVPVIQFAVRSTHFAHASPDTLFLLVALSAMLIGLAYGALDLAWYRKTSRRFARAPRSLPTPAL